jgi:eukaryotic-like serine/threonine-protein kinase
VIGETVARYRILEKLGEGGMGEVYLAEDPSLGRKVALKFLSEALRTDEVARRRFLAEARSAAALDHPFICKIYETGRADGRDYIAMEYVAGRSLKERLADGPLGLEEFYRLAGEITEAVEEAHSRRIVHRDLKPANILLTAGGHVKVMDFGLAKRVTEAEQTRLFEEAEGLTRPGALVGTPAYMAPEQAGGEGADLRSDIFALGVVFYEALTGTHPFRRETWAATLAAVLEEEAEGLRGRRPEVGERLAEVVGRMLAKRPQGRQQSLTEVRAELAEALEETTRQRRRGGAVAAGAGRRVTPAVGSLAEIRPYPGLAAFTTRQAGFFYGREAETEGLWAKLRRSRLLGLIGATGSGKSSFVRAGLIPAAPAG